MDLGTSSLKGPLVDDDGRVLGRGRGVYPTHRARVRVEQDARTWHGALRDVVAHCCRDRRPDGGLETGGAELARAVMRGVALSDRHVIETAMGSGRFLEVHLGGAAASSPEWAREPVWPVACVAARLTTAEAIRTPEATDTAISGEL